MTNLKGSNLGDGSAVGRQTEHLDDVSQSSDLPEGWLNSKLEDVVDTIVGGGTPSKAISSYFQGDIPWMSVKDMNKNELVDTVDHISQEAVENSSTNVIPAGTPIVATRMSLGKIVTASFDSAINQDLKALFLNLSVDKKYFVYWYRSIANLIESFGTGTTVKGIRLEILKGLEFPLPPLAEQKVIADKLDELLAQVESTKARLDAIPAILKSFRQSVLAAAVSGKLTEEWRGDKNKNWQHKTIGDLAEVATGTTPKRGEPRFWVNPSIAWLTSGVTGNDYCVTADQFVTTTAVEECRLKLFKPGTLLLAMYGEGKTRGQVTELKIKATCNQACAAITVNNDTVLTSFVKIRLQENYEETRKAAAGGNQPNLNLKKVREIPVELPSIKEQIQIVHRVEELFGFADKVEAQVNAAQLRVNNLTQSILAKAFRGELTEQWRKDNPELITGDNSASALLKRIKAERDVLAKAKKPAKKTPTKKVSA